MKHLPVVRIFLLAVLLFLVGCNDSASGSAEEKKTTLYTSVVLGACSEVPTSGSLQADGLKCAGEWCIRSYKDSHSAVYIGDCRGCYKLSLSAFDYCEISADVALDVADDPLFISYVNVQEVSKCTSYSYHQFLVPSVDGYRYVKFNDEVFRLEASNKVIACEYNPEFKYGYCVEKGPTHL